MIDDGVKGLGKGDDVQVADISMHILEAIEAGVRVATLPELGVGKTVRQMRRRGVGPR